MITLEPRRSLTESLTVDEIAALSDGELVRRRFDATNIRWTGALSLMALLAAFIQFVVALVSSKGAPHLLPLGFVHLLVALVFAGFFSELAYWQRRRGTWQPHLPVHLIARNLTPWVLAFVIVEFTLLSFARMRGSNAWLVWAMTVPFLAVPIRLDVSRRIALHVSLLASNVINILLLGVNGNDAVPEFIAVVMMNVFAFLIGAWTSRRTRLQTLEDWIQRRAHAREQLRMRDELQYAREVQLSMLPEAPPPLDWVDVAAASIPASEVGGDYYDYFVDGDSLSIVCGDVAGHGLGSGIVLASLRSGFTLLHDSLRDPASVLQRLSDLVARASRRRMLATAAVVRLERLARRAIIASAGHPPVIVSRSGAVEPIELFAPPLGVRLPHSVPSRELPLRSGDVFVLHSDGVYESLNANGETYGIDRLERVVGETNGAGAESIRDAILRDLESFRGGTPAADDVTLVVARVR